MLTNKQMKCTKEEFYHPSFQEGIELCCEGCDYMEWNHDDGRGTCTAFQTQHKEETTQDTEPRCKDCGELLDADTVEYGQCDACFMVEDFARYLEETTK